MISTQTVHIPILVNPIVKALLEPLEGGLISPTMNEELWILDCTFGGGGHTSALLKAIQSNRKLSNIKILGIDQDIRAVERAKIKFEKEIAENRIEILHMRMSEIANIVKTRNFIGLLADLGFSSDQLEDGNRGISFLRDGPLDMRLDQSKGHTCFEILNQLSEDELCQIIDEYGEERFAKKIAKAIVCKRRESGIPNSTLALAELIAKAVPPIARHGRIHAATRTFQALRIFVNSELEELDSLLKDVILSLRTGGRAAIISFHSLEDRKVKQAFKGSPLSESINDGLKRLTLGYGASTLESGSSGLSKKFKLITKKPIEADELEQKSNPRSRSAKLRIAERI